MNYTLNFNKFNTTKPKIFFVNNFVILITEDFNYQVLDMIIYNQFLAQE